MSLNDVWSDIRTVGRSLGVDDRAEAVVRRLQNELDQVSAEVPRSARRPSLACLEWIDPQMSAGNWVPELVEIAGGECLLGLPGRHSPWLAWEELLASDPDVIAVMPCGFDIARTRREMPALTQDPRWHTLRAVREGRVFLTDGNQFFNRPGPRLVESARILAEILHPEHFANSMQERGWVTFESPPLQAAPIESR